MSPSPAQPPLYLSRGIGPPEGSSSGHSREGSVCPLERLVGKPVVYTHLPNTHGDLHLEPVPPPWRVPLLFVTCHGQETCNLIANAQGQPCPGFGGLNPRPSLLFGHRPGTSTQVPGFQVPPGQVCPGACEQRWSWGRAKNGLGAWRGRGGKCWGAVLGKTGRGWEGLWAGLAGRGRGWERQGAGL